MPISNATIAFILFFYLVFQIFTSNPFLTFDVLPNNGTDLNPLLQDKSMVIHPPMLYLGYVGFIIPFAISIVQLLNEKIDLQFGQWIRPWVIVPWGLLSLGIVLVRFQNCVEIMAKFNY